MTERTNADRAARAEAALLAYIAETGDSMTANEIDTWIGDLMCDLRHFCAFMGVRFPENGGAMNFEAEVEEDTAGDFAPEGTWLETDPEPCTQHKDTGRGICCYCGTTIEGSPRT